ncbi:MULTISPECIES: flagellar hook capping FlgD N-terminal domain-containing protein [Pseudomonadota]|jgi:flagellar basal-body rod modification protein FlgD|uniref:flagellar hook assembly protein FlgD n=1 Tax=Pseudomonadota TaxID=1224 RepID=UPI00076AD515|nr:MULTISPECIES: flagellar hook capping FlgD N-terminal domain-containing protein [Pseudomonadota]
MTTITNDFVSSLQKKTDSIPSNNTKESLDQTAFLELMTAQLKFQDPFNPVENKDMVAQMAQFSQVAGISEMNTSLKSMAASFGTSRLAEAANFIGRSVLQDGDTAYADAQGRYSGEFNLANPASNVSLEWLDGAGNVVHTQEMGALQAGRVPFQLVSEDDNGNPANIGPLKVRIKGATASTMSTWLPVTAVESSSTGADAMLVTPAGSISASSARRIA